MTPPSDESAGAEPLPSPSGATPTPLSVSLARAAASSDLPIQPVAAESLPERAAPDGIPTLGKPDAEGRAARRVAGSGEALHVQAQPRQGRARLLIGIVLGVTVLVFVAVMIFLGNAFSRKPSAGIGSAASVLAATATAGGVPIVGVNQSTPTLTSSPVSSSTVQPGGGGGGAPATPTSQPSPATPIPPAATATPRPPTPTPLPANVCNENTGSGCDHKDPFTTTNLEGVSCGSKAYVAAQTNLTHNGNLGGRIEIWYSTACKTNWADIHPAFNAGVCNSVTSKVTTADGRSDTYSYPSCPGNPGSWTNMLYAPTVTAYAEGWAYTTAGTYYGKTPSV